MFHLLACATATAVATRAPPKLSDRVFSPRLPACKDAQQTAVVRLPRFCTDDEIAAIHRAADAVREEVGDVARSNGLEPGSWKTVFFNHRLGQLLPEFKARLVTAATEADRERWGLLDAKRAGLAMRCAEHHTVRCHTCRGRTSGLRSVPTR